MQSRLTMNLFGFSVFCMGNFQHFMAGETLLPIPPESGCAEFTA